MKIVHVMIGGQEYPMCFSTRVAVAVEERGAEKGLDPQESMRDILDSGSMSSAFWLLEQMMIAAVRHLRLEGAPCDVEPLSYDDLLDLVGVDDYPKIFGAIGDAVTEGQKRKVIAEAPPGKNGGPTPSVN